MLVSKSPSDIPEDDQKFFEAEMEDGHSENETENVEDDAEEAVNERQAQKETLPPQPPPTPLSTPIPSDSENDLQESAEHLGTIINPEILDLVGKIKYLQKIDDDFSDDELPELIPLEDAELTSRVDENDLSADEQEATPSDDSSMLEAAKRPRKSLYSAMSSFISDPMSALGHIIPIGHSYDFEDDDEEVEAPGTAVIEEPLQDQDQVEASSELADDSHSPKDKDAPADQSVMEEAIVATHEAIHDEETNDNVQETDFVYQLFEDPLIQHSKYPFDAPTSMAFFDLSDIGKGEYLVQGPDVSESSTDSLESTVEDSEVDQDAALKLSEDEVPSATASSTDEIVNEDGNEDKDLEEIQQDTKDDKQKDPDAIEEVIEDLIDPATSENSVHEEHAAEALQIPKEEKPKPEVIQVGDDSISYLKPDKDTILLGYNLTDPSSFGDHLLQHDYSFIKPHEEMVATYNGQRYICTMKMSQEVDRDLLMILKNGAVHLIENPENKLKRKFGKIATESYVPNNLILAISRKPFGKDTTLVHVDSFASGGKLYNTAVHRIYHVFAKDQDAYHFQILTDPSVIPDADEFRSPDAWLEDDNIVVNKSGYKVIIRSPVELKDDFVGKLTDKVIDIVKPKTGELESTKNDEWAEFLMEKVGWYGYNYLNFGLLPSVRILVVPNP